MAITPTPSTESHPPAETPAAIEQPAVADYDAPDPDQVEFEEALAEVAEEEKVKGATGETPAATTPALTTEPVATTPAAHAPPVQVPVAAVIEERAKRQDAEAAAQKNAQTAAYWKGVADGTYPNPNGVARTHVVADPEPTDLDVIRGQQKSLAERVDQGSLSMADFVVENAKLDDQVHALRRADLIAETSGQGDMYLDTITSKLSNENPWIERIPADELVALKPFAIKDLIRAGVDYQSIAGTPMGDYRLREAVISRARNFGMDQQYGAAAPAPTTPTAPSTTPTARHLDEKIRLAAQAPPALPGMGAQAQTWTEDKVDDMNSLDLENLPMDQLKRVGDSVDRDVSTRRTTAPGRR